MEKQKIFSVVIVDEQGFWDSKSDYVTSATSLNKAKELSITVIMTLNRRENTDSTAKAIDKPLNGLKYFRNSFLFAFSIKIPLRSMSGVTHHNLIKEEHLLKE